MVYFWQGKFVENSFRLVIPLAERKREREKGTYPRAPLSQLVFCNITLYMHYNAIQVIQNDQIPFYIGKNQLSNCFPGLGEVKAFILYRELTFKYARNRNWNDPNICFSFSRFSIISRSLSLPSGGRDFANDAYDATFHIFSNSAWRQKIAYIISYVI